MLKENVEILCEERDWTLRKLACNMSIKKSRLLRGLENGASRDLVRRIAKALDVPKVLLFRRRSSKQNNYTLLPNGTFAWHD